MEVSRPTGRYAGPVMRSARALFLGPDRRVSRPPRRVLWWAVPLVGLLLVGLVTANVLYLQGTRHVHLAVAVVLSVASVAPAGLSFHRPLLAFRIAYPMLFLGTVFATDTEPWPWSPMQVLGVLVVMVMLAVVEDSPVTLWACGFTVVVPFLYVEPGRAVIAAVVLVAIALLGDVLTRRRQGHLALAEQSALTQQERTRREVLEERTRIAREMHDVVAHHMSMVAVQAETAPFRITGLSEPVRDELATIASEARAALTDMRRLLGVLRSDDDEALRAPQPALDDVPQLVEAARRAGVRADASLPEDGEPIPASVGLVAYRIVQEAIANAARHAPGAAVHIDARVVDDRLLLRIVNDAATTRAPRQPGAGLGLLGMRERAESLGGTVTTGPAETGGYQVTARLPLRETS